jgi:RHH-type transcriptional regulator, rel operon repressor / antitoxin RelB
MVALNVRISDELSNVLAKSAEYLDRPKGYLVRKALEAYLQELQEDIEDYNDAVEALKDDSPTISLEEIIRKSGLADQIGFRDE